MDDDADLRDALLARDRTRAVQVCMRYMDRVPGRSGRDLDQFLDKQQREVFCSDRVCAWGVRSAHNQTSLALYWLPADKARMESETQLQFFCFSTHVIEQLRRDSLRALWDVPYEDETTQ